MNTRARLAIAIYMHDLSGGGVERQVLILAQELRALDFDVTLVLHSSDGDLKAVLPADLPVHDLQSPRTIADITRLAGYLRKTRPDVLLANVDHNNVAALLAKAVSFTRTKVVICQHNALSPDYSAQSRWTYRYISRAYSVLSPLIAAAVAVSNGIGKELRDLAHIPQRKIRVIHNPVVGDDFAERMAAPITHPWLDEPGTVFVTAGRMVPQKDHATLLEAFALHRKHHASRLLMLGVGPLREDLERQAQALEIAGAVDFLGFQSNPLPFFRKASCFVLSSNSEGFGNVLVEAMGCGTPIISTDCPHGPAEILEHGRYGVLTRVGDVRALSVAMDNVGMMRERWPEAVLQARANDFSNTACGTKFGVLFQAVTARTLSNKLSFKTGVISRE